MNDMDAFGAEWEREELERMYGEPPPSTTTELVREQARYDGQFCPDAAWLLSDFDTWERNPHYRGPAVPHPESENDREDLEAPSLRALGIDPQDPCMLPVSDDEIPF